LIAVLLGACAFAIGGVVAFAELLSRYRGGSILTTPSSYLYISLNGIVSVIAYVLLEHMQFEVAGLSSQVVRVLVASTSAMLVLRASIASVRIGDREVDVGIAGIMTVFLDAADKSFDRSRGEQRLRRVSSIMKGVAFSDVEKDLPMMVLSIMENMSQEDQKALSRDVQKLSRDDSIGHETKSVVLGLTIAKYTGLSLLKVAVQQFRELRKHLGTEAMESEQVQIENLERRFEKKLSGSSDGGGVR
jgi:hypothetical protein